jgi:hypothetical protein
MKTRKSFLLVAVAVLAALFVGARRDSGARPEAVDADRWVALSDKAGFVLTTEKGNTIGAELYLKTDQGWRRGRLENPVSVLSIGR